MPAEIAAAGHALGLAGAPAWGVTLPGSTAAEISGLMAQHSGGDLVIGDDGGVSLQR